MRDLIHLHEHSFRASRETLTQRPHAILHTGIRDQPPYAKPDRARTRNFEGGIPPFSSARLEIDRRWGLCLYPKGNWQNHTDIWAPSRWGRCCVPRESNRRNQTDMAIAPTTSLRHPEETDSPKAKVKYPRPRELPNNPLRVGDDGSVPVGTSCHLHTIPP